MKLSGGAPFFNIVHKIDLIFISVLSIIVVLYLAYKPMLVKAVDKEYIILKLNCYSSLCNKLITIVNYF